LIGLEVFNQLTQEVVGTVVDVFSAGNDLLEVKINQPQQIISSPDLALPTGKKRKQPKIPKQKTVLIPFVKAIAPVVDLQAGRIEITPPPGLLEIE
jgi:16S rRNA processing protein RimM